MIKKDRDRDGDEQSWRQRYKEMEIEMWMWLSIYWGWKDIGTAIETESTLVDMNIVMEVCQRRCAPLEP